MFEQYNIMSDGDPREAATKLGAKSVRTTWGQLAVNGPSDAIPISRFSEKKLEAPPGFEPGMEVLQTSALPLGDGAVRLSPGVAPPAGGREQKERWSGKRDSNPRLRPWQGRTLPLSYSRSRRRRGDRTTAVRGLANTRTLGFRSKYLRGEGVLGHLDAWLPFLKVDGHRVEAARSIRPAPSHEPVKRDPHDLLLLTISDRCQTAAVPIASPRLDFDEDHSVPRHAR